MHAAEVVKADPGFRSHSGLDSVQAAVLMLQLRKLCIGWAVAVLPCGQQQFADPFHVTLHVRRLHSYMHLVKKVCRRAVLVMYS